MTAGAHRGRPADVCRLDIRRRALRLLPFVEATAMADPNHEDEEFAIEDIVDDATVPHPNAIAVVEPNEFPYASRARVIGKSHDCGNDAVAHTRREALQVALSRRREPDGVRHPGYRPTR